MQNLPNPQTAEASAILSALSTSLDKGLTEREAADRLKRFGKNTIEEKEKESLFRLLLSQFTNPMAFLLLFAAALSLLFKEWLDGTAIVAVIVINAIIGFLMEFQAGRSMDALKKLVTVSAKVVREGSLKEMSSELLVPGDILFIEAGDMIGADARLLMRSGMNDDEIRRQLLVAFTNRPKDGFEAEQKRKEHSVSESMSTIGG